MKKTLLIRAIHLLLLTISFSAACTVNGQQTQTQSQRPPLATDPASLPIAISKVKEGHFGLVDIEIIARWHAVQAVPLLETQFERSKDPNTKRKIANALVRLGEKSGPYWNYLADQARQALRDVPPTPFDYDADGKAAPAELSRRFTEWASQHHMSPPQAWNYMMVQVMGAVVNVGSSDDDRGVPILREALTSNNDLVKAEAARGLAELHNAGSIPAIIHACQNAPKEAAAAIAEPLVYFDDSSAQHALDEYVPKNTVQELREARADGKTPYR